MLSMPELPGLWHCLLTGFDFETDPGFGFDLEPDRGFAILAIHQNDLRLRAVPVRMPGQQELLMLARKKVVYRDAARWLVFSLGYRKSSVNGNSFDGCAGNTFILPGVCPICKKRLKRRLSASYELTGKLA